MKKICFIGDSRTEQLSQCSYASKIADNVDFISSYGSGWSWFRGTALSTFASRYAEYSTCIILMGINDLVNEGDAVTASSRYKSAIQTLANEVQYSEINFYFATIPCVTAGYVSSSNPNTQADQKNSYIRQFNINMTPDDADNWGTIALNEYFASHSLTLDPDDCIHYTTESSNAVLEYLYGYITGIYPTKKTLDISALNDGNPKANPYELQSAIPPSFKNVDYYDCAIPYNLTVQELGGYSRSAYPDGQHTVGPMPQSDYNKKVASMVNFENAGDHPWINTWVTEGKFDRISDPETGCHIIVTKQGVKFYETAVQDFFLRGTHIAQSTDGQNYSYFGRRAGCVTQVLDVILTDGTCIHFIISDVNSYAHTNGGPYEPANLAPSNYDQYHNIISNFNPNTLEMRADSSQSVRDWAKKFGLNNNGNNIAFYRMYQFKIGTFEEDFVFNPEAADNINDIKNAYYKISSSGGSSSTTTPPEEIDEKNSGIKDLKIDFNIWKTNTKLDKLGNYIRFRVQKNDKSTIWNDLTNNKQYTPQQLNEYFGISYTSVNDKFDAKFEVVQAPLPPELGGTGVTSMRDLYKAINGVDTNTIDSSYVPRYNTNSSVINLPNVAVGQVITAEARSENWGSAAVGDQGQNSAQELDIEMASLNKWDAGEVAFIYERDLNEFTYVYRLYSDDPIKNAEYRGYALAAANHACFICQHPNFGYNYGSVHSTKLWNYITQNLGNVQFSLFPQIVDINCINLCRYAYAAVMYDKVSDKTLFSNSWTTAGLLRQSNHTLENIGFKRFDSSYARVANNLEIGDILIRNSHAAIVVAVGGKTWKAGNVDYNPKYGEVLT